MNDKLSRVIESRWIAILIAILPPVTIQVVNAVMPESFRWYDPRAAYDATVNTTVLSVFCSIIMHQVFKLKRLQYFVCSLQLCFISAMAFLCESSCGENSTLNFILLRGGFVSGIALLLFLIYSMRIAGWKRSAPRSVGTFLFASLIGWAMVAIVICPARATQLYEPIYSLNQRTVMRVGFSYCKYCNWYGGGPGGYGRGWCVEQNRLKQVMFNKRILVEEIFRYNDPAYFGTAFEVIVEENFEDGEQLISKYLIDQRSYWDGSLSEYAKGYLNKVKSKKAIE